MPMYFHFWNASFAQRWIPCILVCSLTMPEVLAGLADTHSIAFPCAIWTSLLSQPRFALFSMFFRDDRAGSSPETQSQFWTENTLADGAAYQLYSLSATSKPKLPCYVVIDHILTI
jgi:hypothetical protein